MYSIKSTKEQTKYHWFRIELKDMLYLALCLYWFCGLDGTNLHEHQPIYLHADSISLVKSVVKWVVLQLYPTMLCNQCYAIPAIAHYVDVVSDPYVVVRFRGTPNSLNTTTLQSDRKHHNSSPHDSCAIFQNVWSQMIDFVWGTECNSDHSLKIFEISFVFTVSLTDVVTISCCCMEQNRKISAYGFGTTCGWVNNDRIFILGELSL